LIPSISLLDYFGDVLRKIQNNGALYVIRNFLRFIVEAGSKHEQVFNNSATASYVFRLFTIVFKAAAKKQRQATSVSSEDKSSSTSAQ